MSSKDVTNHFTNFVYVFSVKKEKEFLSWLLKEEMGWRLRLYNFRKNSDKQLVGYYLPYMRRILYPSSLWDRKDFKNFFDGGSIQKADTLYALSCKDFRNGRFQGTKLAISFEAGTRFIEGEICEIALRMLKRGVAFLVLKAKLVGEDIDVDDLLDFNCCCRVLDDEINLPHFPNIKIYTQGMGVFGKMRSFIEFLTGGFASGRGEDLPGGRMLVYSYCCISQDMWHTSSDDIFQKFKYVWRKDMNPMVEGKLYREESDYAPWRYSRYGFTVESGVVLCCDRDVFNRDILPFYFGGNFFDLYLFSLYQRIRLMRFSHHLASTEVFLSSKKKVEGLREDILDFFNQHIFNQVSNYSIGNEIWRRWQEVLEIESMFLQVHQELADMDGYLKSIRQERMDRSLAYVTFLLVPVSVISGILGSNITELQGLSIRNPWIWGTTLSLYAVLLITYARTLIRRNKRERGGGNI